MLLSGITHADARDGKKHPFRGLSKQGRKESKKAADRFKKLVEAWTNERGEPVPAVDVVVSSPKVRCLETVILMAKAASQLTATSEVQVRPALKAGAITGRELADLANEVEAQHMLVSGHADLVQALPEQVELAPEAAKNGWFTTRPVLFVIDYAAGKPWESAQVLSCEGLVDGKWISLLA